MVPVFCKSVPSCQRMLSATAAEHPAGTAYLFHSVPAILSGGVPALAPVLVLLNQELHKPGFMLCRIAGHFPQIGEYTSGQEVGAPRIDISNEVLAKLGYSN